MEFFIPLFYVLLCVKIHVEEEKLGCFCIKIAKGIYTYFTYPEFKYPKIKVF